MEETILIPREETTLAQVEETILIPREETTRTLLEEMNPIPLEEVTLVLLEVIPAPVDQSRTHQTLPQIRQLLAHPFSLPRRQRSHLPGPRDR